MIANSTDSQKNIKNELEFRVWFKSEFNIDYLDAVKILQEKRSETHRLWRQLLVSHGVIK